MNPGDTATAPERPETPTCCGAPCVTPYCPYCGKKLHEPSKFLGLMVYLDKRRGDAVKRGNAEAAAQFADWYDLVEAAWMEEPRVEAGE